VKRGIILLAFIFLGCFEKQQPKKGIPNYLKSEYFSMNTYLQDKYNAIQKGDEHSYNRLGIYYCYNPTYSYEYLSTSIIMAEKYNIKSANYGVYYSMVKIYNNNKYTSYLFKNLNFQQREFALYYLQRGAEKENLSCVVELARIYRYGIGCNKNLKKAENLEKILIKSDPSYDVEKTDKFEMNIER
jgi:TPR repeat protein